jgi:SpoVK/Ycf46/Vps4 family AAA+-type ATPase
MKPQSFQEILERLFSSKQNKKEDEMNLNNYLKAGYPALYIVTPEADRAMKTLRPEGWQFYSWDCLRGITEPETGRAVEDILDPLGALKWLTERNDTVLFAQNFHHFIGAVEIIQGIQNCMPYWKALGSCLAMVGPQVILPTEVEKYFIMLEFQLPSMEELRVIQQELGESVGVEVNMDAVEAALGLTEFESETAFALSLVVKRQFCLEIITEQKKQMIRRSGLMEFWPPATVNQVGGLELLKQYITNRKKAFEHDGEHLPKPKAMLLVGVPGTGKSLSCKAAASILDWPLIRLDISALKGSLVGESERKIRQATATIDAFGKAIVWMDELDKTFSGVKSSGQTDGGTTSCMFGHFLTWMESESPILVMATANNINELPPELLRAGRFDAIFFVDIPNLPEREEIIEIMNQRYGSEIPLEYAGELQGWTGAEIEQLAKDSLFDGLEVAFKTIVPLSRTMKEDITALQEWAKTRARKANAPEDTSEIKTIRRIR